MITGSTLVNGTITVIIDNGKQILTARTDHPKWNEIVTAFKAQDENKLLELFSLKRVVEKYSSGKISICDNVVSYNNQILHGVDVDRILGFLREGLPYIPIANYMERKFNNPSKRAIDEMYNFLEHRNMPLTPEGKIIAYKGVGRDYYSIQGNLQTVVLQGKTDFQGRILNEIGATIEVERRCVDDDYKKDCSTGLHAGSLKYATGWGPVTVLVEIDPADVVSVPSDCECQKLRCCKYKVLGEYTGPLPSTYTTEFSQTPSELPTNDVFVDDNDDTSGGYSDYDDYPNYDNEPPLNNLVDNVFDSYKNREEKLIDDIYRNNDPISTMENEGGLVLKEPTTSKDIEQNTNATEPNKVTEVNESKSSAKYMQGYSRGIEDGKGHNCRIYKEEDLKGLKSQATKDYISGYNDGYRNGRKDYKKK